MATRAQRMRVILFLSLGFLAIGGFIFVIAGENAFERRSNYFVDFRGISVNGLEIGSTVRYNGISVGTVEGVEFGGEALDQVMVEVSIREETPLREGIKARLVPVGITGLREIELFGARAEEPPLAAGSRIPAEPSTLDRLTGPATNIANEVEFIVFGLSELLRGENQEKLEQALDDAAGIIGENRGRISRIVRNVDGFVEENRRPLSEAIAGLESTSRNLSMTTVQLNTMMAELAEGGTGEDVGRLLTGLNRTVVQTEESIRNIESVVAAGEDGLLDSLLLLEETLEYLNNFAIMISEDPSRLIR
ncbi:MAG: MlaD family protein [Spirochaetaceae bacterium]